MVRVAIVPASAVVLATAPGASAGSITSAQKKEIFDTHNKYRCMHGVPLFTWDDSIQAEAQSYADTMKTFEHSSDASRTHSNQLWGENLAVVTGRPYPGAEATKDWYDEIKLTPNKDGLVKVFATNTAHYTALVWDKPTKIGCGRSSASPWYWVCQYDPIGNMAGQFTYKVRAPWHTEAECLDPAKPTGTPAPAPAPEPEVCDNDKADACVNALLVPTSKATACNSYVPDFVKCNPGVCCTTKIIDRLAMFFAAPFSCTRPTCPAPAPSPSPSPSPALSPRPEEPADRVPEGAIGRPLRTKLPSDGPWRGEVGRSFEGCAAVSPIYVSEAG